jgi:hypothetical protein
MKFVGLEDVDQVFHEFKNRVFDPLDPLEYRRIERKKYPDERKLGHFVFLMRSVMIRHSQNQQYRGTSTTLMSLPTKVRWIKSRNS